MPAGLDDYINATLAGLPGNGGAGGDNIDYAKILTDRPDVAQKYIDESTRDAKSKANLQSIGVYSPIDFAKWWYQNQGKPAGYVGPTLGSVPGTTPGTTPTTTPAATTTPDASTPAAPGSPLTAKPGTPEYTASARSLALLKAQQAVQGRGLDFEQYKPEVNSYLDQLFSAIPAGDANPQSYIDPNFADQILNGDQAKARIGYTNQVNSKFGNPGLDYHSLDDTINSILGDASKSGQDMLDNGLKRGQFNEIGVAAGQNKLAAAKAKARAKLDSTAQDVFNTYDSKFTDLYDRALKGASGYQLGQNFDETPFDNEFSRLKDSAQTDATGQLYSAIGDSPLINLTDIRGAVGVGQGSTNLTDLDVLDAISKRKNASDVGRGLGSQGAF
jgi:hypothetical protein